MLILTLFQKNQKYKYYSHIKKSLKCSFFFKCRDILSDYLFLSACAASQGCCNNITFGDENFGYYETVAGGSGAGPTWHGRQDDTQL